MTPTIPPDMLPRHRAFILAYTSLGKETYQNASLSAKMAGYSHKSAGDAGKNLVKHPKIAEVSSAIIKHQEYEIENATRITREEITALSKEFLKECGAKHSNTPRYMDLMAKVNGLYAETINNAIVVYAGANPSDPDNERSLKTRLERMLDARKTLKTLPTPSP